MLVLFDCSPLYAVLVLAASLAFLSASIDRLAFQRYIHSVSDLEGPAATPVNAPALEDVVLTFDLSPPTTSLSIIAHTVAASLLDITRIDLVLEPFGPESRVVFWRVNGLCHFLGLVALASGIHCGLHGDFTIFLWVISALAGIYLISDLATRQTCASLHG